jgi:hypothetical protein
MAISTHVQMAYQASFAPPLESWVGWPCVRVNHFPTTRPACAAASLGTTTLLDASQSWAESIRYRSPPARSRLASRRASCSCEPVIAGLINALFLFLSAFLFRLLSLQFFLFPVSLSLPLLSSPCCCFCQPLTRLLSLRSCSCQPFSSRPLYSRVSRSCHLSINVTITPRFVFLSAFLFPQSIIAKFFASCQPFCRHLSLLLSYVHMTLPWRAMTRCSLRFGHREVRSYRQGHVAC